MIITANSVPHSVDILKRFKPVYKRALAFVELMSGKIRVSDRGTESDKYSCTFTVIGDNVDIEALISDLNLESGQITIDTEGGKIFGPGIDHSSPFTCNIGGVFRYPVRDPLTTVIELTVMVVSPVIYDASVPIELPELYYQLPIERILSNQVTTFDSMTTGDYGRTKMFRNIIPTVNGPITKQSVKVKLKQCNEEMAKLHRFVADTRGDPFTLATNTHLELFLNSNSEDVIIKDFKFVPDGLKFWNVTMTLTNDVA